MKADHYQKGNFEEKVKFQQIKLSFIIKAYGYFRWPPSTNSRKKQNYYIWGGEYFGKTVDNANKSSKQKLRCMEIINGAKRALIPIENKRSFFEVSAEVLESVDPIFYSEVKQATFKALGLV